MGTLLITEFCSLRNSNSTPQLNAAGTEYTDVVTSLTPGTQYDFDLWTTAAEDDGTSFAFAKALARTTGTAPVAAPAAPVNLSATVDRFDGNQIDLHWINTPGTESGYEILRSIGGGSYAEIGETGADETTYTDHLSGTFHPGQIRQYQVIALAAPATGPASAPATSQPVVQPYAPTYTLGADNQGKLQADGGTASRYFWHRVLQVKDKNGGVIIQHIVITLVAPNGRTLSKEYWEAIPVAVGTDQVDDYFKNNTAFDGVAKVTEVGEAIFYPKGSTPPGFAVGSVREAGDFPATITDPKLPQVKPLTGEITWTPPSTVAVK